MAVVSDTRGGTGFVELLLVVSLVALAGVAGAKIYGISVRDHFTGDSSGVEALGAAPATSPTARATSAVRGDTGDEDESGGEEEIVLEPAPGFPTLLVAATRVLGTVLSPLGWLVADDEPVAEREEPTDEDDEDEDAVAVATAPTHAPRRPPRAPPALAAPAPPPESSKSFVQLSWWVLLAAAIAALLLPSLRAIVRRWRSADSTASRRAMSRRIGAWSRSSCAAATSPRSTSSRPST